MSVLKTQFFSQCTNGDLQAALIIFLRPVLPTSLCGRVRSSGSALGQSAVYATYSDSHCQWSALPRLVDQSHPSNNNLTVLTRRHLGTWGVGTSPSKICWHRWVNAVGRLVVDPTGTVGRWWWQSQQTSLWGVGVRGGGSRALAGSGQVSREYPMTSRVAKHWHPRCSSSPSIFLFLVHSPPPPPPGASDTT